jgi:hypothetical protein
MPKILSLALLAPVLALALVGCSSAPMVSPSVLSAATTRGVSASTTAKMSSARALDFDDIQNLVSKGVPASTVIAYLNSTKRVYHFSSAQIAELESAGATPQLVNYLEESAGFFGKVPATARNNRNGETKPEYYNTQQYQDEQPFAYNEPAVDGFCDSGYEESLYSPFSFN